MARNATLDQMTEFAMEELLSGDAQRKRAMVRRMAERWPAEPALALVSADVHAVQSMGQVPSVAEDLLHFWRRVDPSFLRIR